jgi:hypothetical protein
MTTNNQPLSKLQGFFSKPDSAIPAPGAMNVEKYRQLLERALSAIPTGQRLLRFAAQQRITTHVIPGKGTSGYLPENRAVYVALPAGLSTVLPMDVLELGAYLRQAELQILGAKNPDESMTSEQFTIAFDAKIIDSIAVMCKMATEFDEKGQSEFIDALLTSGHSELYEAYRNYGQGEELVDVYYKLIEKTA